MPDLKSIRRERLLTTGGEPYPTPFLFSCAKLKLHPAMERASLYCYFLSSPGGMLQTTPPT